MAAVAAGARSLARAGRGHPARHRARTRGSPDLVDRRTGMGEARNAILVRSADAVIAIGGSWGTLSELAHAMRRAADRPPGSIPVVSLGGWRVVDADGQPVPGVARGNRRRPRRRPRPGRGGLAPPCRPRAVGALRSTSGAAVPPVRWRAGPRRWPESRWRQSTTDAPASSGATSQSRGSGWASPSMSTRPPAGSAGAAATSWPWVVPSASARPVGGDRRSGGSGRRMPAPRPRSPSVPGGGPGRNGSPIGASASAYVSSAATRIGGSAVTNADVGGRRRSGPRRGRPRARPTSSRAARPRSASARAARTAATSPGPRPRPSTSRLAVLATQFARVAPDSSVRSPVASS